MTLISQLEHNAFAGMAAQGTHRSVHGQRATGIHEEYQEARGDTQIGHIDKSLVIGRKINIKMPGTAALVI